jgi:hypothetical protein
LFLLPELLPGVKQKFHTFSTFLFLPLIKRQRAME